MKHYTTNIAGLDLGDKRSQICVLDPEGEKIEESVIQTTEKGIRGYFSKREKMRVVLEAGTHSPWVSRHLEEMGHEVIVANPRRVQLIWGNTNKTDRNDAELLSRIGRVDPKLLGPIEHRNEDTQVDLAIIRSRDILVRTRRSLINHVRGVVKSMGHRLARSSGESFHKLAMTIPEAVKSALEPVMDCIAKMTGEIKGYDQKIEEISREKYPETTVLREIPGVGAITALSFILILGNPNKFKNNRVVGAYLGLRPRKDESGESDPGLRITKAGNTYLRSLLVNCAQYILGPFAPDTDLRRCGLRLAGSGGRHGKKRAVVAVARKLSVLLLHLWKTGEVYEPLRNAVKNGEDITPVEDVKTRGRKR